MAFSIKQVQKIRFLSLCVLALSSISGWAIKYGPEDSALVAACGILPTRMGGSPFSSGRVLPDWKWNDENPYYDDLDLSPSRVAGTPFRFPTCESIIMDALLADERGGPRAVAARCQSQRSQLQRAKIDYNNGVNAGSSRSLSFGNDAAVICKNPSKFDAEFACAYMDHQKDFRSFSVQLQAIKEVEAFCAGAGVMPLPTNSNSGQGRGMASPMGINPHTGQPCHPNSAGLVIMQPQKTGWQSFLEVAPTLAAIGSLTASNYWQQQNASLAIKYNHENGFGNAVSPWSTASSGGLLAGIGGIGGVGGSIGIGGGIGGIGGVGIGGMGGGFGSCGVPPYNMGYSGC